MTPQANDRHEPPAEEEEPAEIAIEETGQVVDEPPEFRGESPAPEWPPRHGQLVETTWTGFPNFGCSSCSFASLDRSLVESHVNQPTDH
jgi:hypothetical protein